MKKLKAHAAVQHIIKFESSVIMNQDSAITIQFGIFSEQEAKMYTMKMSRIWMVCIAIYENTGT